MTESELTPRIKTYSISEIKEGLRGGLKLPEGAILKIAKPESKNRAFFYGGLGAEIKFDVLRDVMQKGYQLKVSIGESVSEKDAGKARVFNGQELPDKPSPPATSIEEALDLFKQALEKEKTAGQVAFKKTSASAETEQAAKIEVIRITTDKKSSHSISVELKINGETAGIVWYQGIRDNIPTKGRFTLDTITSAEGDLSIPNGTYLEITSYLKPECFIRITGGKDVKLSIADLKELWSKNKDGFYIDIQFLTKDLEYWYILSPYFEKEGGRANVRYVKDLLLDPQIRTNLSIEEAVALFKEELEKANPAVSS